MSGSKRAQALRLAKPLIGLLLLGLLLSQVETRALWALAQRGRPVLLVASLLSFVVALAIFQALRLHVLVAEFTGGLAASLRLFFIGAFFNNLLPSNVGGDAVRLLYLRRMGDGDWAAPLARLLLHRATGILALMAALVLYAPFRWQRLRTLLAARLTDAHDGNGGDSLLSAPWALPLVALAAVAALALLALLVLHPRFGKLRMRLVSFLRRVAHAATTVSAPRLTALAALTVAFHGMRAVGLFLALGFLDASIDPWDLVPVLAVTALVALVPLTVGGLGLVEGSLGAGLTMFGVPPEAAVGAALLHRGGLVLVALVGGVVYLRQRDAIRGGGLS